MSQSKVRLYKNPKRNETETYSKYVPQYQQMGIEPLQAPQNPTFVVNAKNNQNKQKQNARSGPVTQPYAEVVEPAIGSNKPFPNVGNNIEQTWSSLTNNIEDNFEHNEYNEYIEDQSLVDNNDYVTDNALGLSRRSNRQPHASEVVVQNNQSDDSLYDILKSLNSNYYLLMIDDVPFCSGIDTEVEEIANQLIMGDHEYCDGQPIEIDRVLIIKKTKIKVGLFLE